MVQNHKSDGFQNTADELTASMLYSSITSDVGTGDAAILDTDVEKGGGVGGGPAPKDGKISAEDEYLNIDTAVSSATLAVEKSNFKDEMKETFKLACPMTLSFLFGLLISTVSMIFCGHLGTSDLAALGLATSFVNITGYSVGAGLASACDTLFSQTYGSGKKKDVGIHLQKSLMIMFLYSFPVMGIVANSESLFYLLGQDPIVSKLAGDYLLIYLPGIVGTYIYIVLGKYLMNQNIVNPLIYIGIIANIVNVALQYVLINIFDFGIRGSACSVAVTFCLMPVFAVIYMLISGVHKETWPGWCKESLFDWWTFNRYAIPGMFMVLFEWTCFEISIFIAGYLGEVDLSAQSIISQIASYSYFTFYGISVAGGVMVGQHLGAGNTTAAARCSRVVGVIALILGTTALVLFSSMNSLLPQIFTSDEEVIELTSWLLLLVSAFEFMNCFGVVYSGLLRGCGWQNVGAISFFIAFYCISLPIGIPLMLLTPLRVSGFWYAHMVGETVCALLFTFLIFKMNWKKEAEKILQSTLFHVKAFKRIQINATEKTETIDEKMPLLGRKSVHLAGRLICKRLMFLLILSLTLVAGCLTKIFVPQPQILYPCLGNSTISINCTSDNFNS